MHIAVLGAGLQGACVALALAAAGHHVDLYDREDRAMARASLNNEGKLHLGFVYARDASLGTARMMLEGALSFGPLLRRWIGPEAAALPLSPPYRYLVHRASRLDADAVAAHLASCHALACEMAQAPAADYMETDLREPPRRLARGTLEQSFDPAAVVAAFTTPEIAIDPDPLAALVRARLAAESAIRPVFGAAVAAVAPRGERLEVAFAHAGGSERAAYDHVVNALWDGRLAVDASLGLVPARGWLHRLRYNLRVFADALPAALPCVTVVHGAFGDVVTYASGAGSISWYPAGMVEISTALAPPRRPATLAGEASSRLRAAIVAGMGAIVPAVAAAREAIASGSELRGGTVFAWGESDIDDAASGLHRRDGIGVETHGRYHSVNTGKLTTAPLFARQLVARIGAAG